MLHLWRKPGCGKELPKSALRNNDIFVEHINSSPVPEQGFTCVSYMHQIPVIVNWHLKFLNNHMVNIQLRLLALFLWSRFLRYDIHSEH